jgi:hypothetical protein
VSDTGHVSDRYTSVEHGTAEQSLLADNGLTTVNAAMEYAVLTEVCPLDKSDADASPLHLLL